MANNEYSFVNEIKGSAQVQKDITIPLCNDVKDFDVHLRNIAAFNGERIHDVFINHTDGVGDFLLGEDITTLVSDESLEVEIFPAVFIQRRATPRGMVAVESSSDQGKVTYDIFNFSSGGVGGFGFVTLQINRIRQDAGPDAFNNFLENIQNLGALAGFDVLKRENIEGAIVYDIITAYLPV